MSNISPEYLTMLSCATALIDEGHIEEAERTYIQLWTLAKSHGNDEEKQLSVRELLKFLRTRGRSQDIESLLMEPELMAIKSAQLHNQVKNIIVIGSSAGGVEAVSVLLSGLQSKLDAAVFLVQGTPGHSPNELAKILNKRSALPVKTPVNGESILSGHVYLAPPNQHLIVKKGSICLGNGPKENRARPSVDVLFRTAAHAYGKRVVAVVLSGVLNDGTAGVMSVKTHGGKSIVQDPDQAVFDSMPRSAITFTEVDHVIKVEEMGALLVSLVAESGEQDGGANDMPEYRDQADVGEVGGPGINNVAPYPPSALTCPSCGGAVWEIQEQSLTLFKCHTGHSYTAELMLEEQSEAVDGAAWTLLRAISESVHLRLKLAEWARSTGRMDEAAFHEQQAKEAEKQGQAFRSLLLSNEKGRD